MVEGPITRRLNFMTMSFRAFRWALWLWLGVFEGIILLKENWVMIYGQKIINRCSEGSYWRVHFKFSIIGCFY
jgi:hypothetical protein